MVLLVYVDDIVFAGPDLDTLQEMEETISTKFKMTDGKNLSFILGIRITVTSESTTLDQSHTTKQIFERFGMQDAKPAATPLDPDAAESLSNPHTDDTTNERDVSRYAEAIGSLLWLSTMTRPDITFATSFLARFTSAPTDHHWAAVKRVFRYLRGTANYGITYHADTNRDSGGVTDPVIDPSVLTVFTDADWAGCRETRASTSGFVILHAGGPVSWRAQRQTCVATSSTEAEYVAGSAATQELVWLRAITRTIDFDVAAHPTPLFIDHEGAEALARDVRTSRRSKHIDIRYHHMRQAVTDKQIEILRINTTDNPADTFTKPLARIKFENFRSIIGVNCVNLDTDTDAPQ